MAKYTMISLIISVLLVSGSWGLMRPSTFPLKGRILQASGHDRESGKTNKEDVMCIKNESMFSVSYDPLQSPDQAMLERDLEDLLMERATRFFDEKLVMRDELCYLVGLEDKSVIDSSDKTSFTMEESLAELSELAGAAGLKVVGTTYQRLTKPDMQYYIGVGKTNDIKKAMLKAGCTCVILDAELTPSQQKNLELSFNQDSNKAGRRKKDKKAIKVVDRTALILDIFAQHARTKEGHLQVQLALLTYRLPRLTNMWTHLERQSAGARGRSNGGVSLRGPGETQLESDQRQMNKKISVLNRAIDNVRRHRSQHRMRRKRLGVPVVALVGYTNAGKSTLLNALSSSTEVYAADMLFATLDPTTRMVCMSGSRTSPNILLTDTVGFIQKLPTNLVAAFRATIEEINEADILVHVTDVTNPIWRKQEAAVLRELAEMGLAEKPIVTIWNKIDLIPERKDFFQFEAAKRPSTVAISSVTSEGFNDFKTTLEETLSQNMMEIVALLPYVNDTSGVLLSSMHSLGVLETVRYEYEGIFVKGYVPPFLYRQLWHLCGDEEFKNGINLTKKQQNADFDVEDDWVALGKGRHSAREEEIDMDTEAEHLRIGDDAQELHRQGLSPDGLIDFD